MGGEKHQTNPTEPGRPGSPPHGRGKVHFGGPEKGPLGITPAWAGKRVGSLTAAATPEDHPRMGGEKLVGFTLFVIPQGSPPHGRGKASGSSMAA